MFGLQKEFEKTIKEYSSPKSVLLRLLNRRVDELGIALTEAQQEMLSKQILKYADGTIKIELVDDQVRKAGFSKEEELIPLIQNIFDDLGEDVENFATDFEEKLPETLQNIISDIAPVILQFLKSSALEMLMERQEELGQFRDNLFSTWGPAINLLEMYLVIAFEAGEYANKEWRLVAANTNNIGFDILTRLHARACQISSEIIVLLKNGFADGAHARWRSLHEVTVVASFIADNNNELAEKYLLHENIESYKAALQYRQYSKQLGLEEITEQEIDDITKVKDELIGRFGKSYKSDYGWASSVLDKQHPTFRDIEKKVDLGHLRPYYKLASHNVHANPKGVFLKLGILDDTDNVLLAGPSNIGLAEHRHSMALSLGNITTQLLLAHEPIVDTLVISKILLELQREIGELFYEAHESIIKNV